MLFLRKQSKPWATQIEKHFRVSNYNILVYSTSSHSSIPPSISPQYEYWVSLPCHFVVAKTSSVENGSERTNKRNAVSTMNSDAFSRVKHKDGWVSLATVVSIFRCVFGRSSSILLLQVLVQLVRPRSAMPARSPDSRSPE